MCNLFTWKFYISHIQYICDSHTSLLLLYVIYYCCYYYRSSVKSVMRLYCFVLFWSFSPYFIFFLYVTPDEMKVNLKFCYFLILNIYLLALCTVDTLFSSGSCCCGVSRSTQHDHIMPPEHKSTGFPPLSTHDIDNPHSNLRPL